MGLNTLLQRLGFAKRTGTTRVDQMSAALHTSVISILKDAAPEDRAELLDETLDQYREAVLDAAMQKSAFAKAGTPPWATGESDDEEDDEEDEEAQDDEDVPDDEAAPDDDEDEEDDPEPEDEMDAKLKKQYDDRIAALQAQVAEQAVAKASITKMQEELDTLRKADETRAHIAKATTLLGEHATADEITQAADLIAKGVDTTLLEKLANQRAVFAKAAALTVEVGSSNGMDTTSPNARIAKAAEALLAKDATLTKEQAIASALAADPTLYAATL